MRNGWEDKTQVIVYLQNVHCRYNWGITGAPLLPTCQAVGAVAYTESSPTLCGHYYPQGPGEETRATRSRSQASEA